MHDLPTLYVYLKLDSRWVNIPPNLPKTETTFFMIVYCVIRREEQHIKSWTILTHGKVFKNYNVFYVCVFWHYIDPPIDTVTDQK